MTLSKAISEYLRLTAGTPIIFETDGVVFFATIIDAATDDRLLVTIQEATDPRFAARLPKRLWLMNVTSRLRNRSLRIAGWRRNPALSETRLAA